MRQAFFPPVIGQWYRPSSGKGQIFEVISIDESGTRIEIQFFDGNLDELEFESWLELEINEEQAPENWLGAVDIPDLEDLGSHITDTTLDDWLLPFEEISVDDDNIVIIEQDINQISFTDEH